MGRLVFIKYSFFSLHDPAPTPKFLFTEFNLVKPFKTYTLQQYAWKLARVFWRNSEGNKTEKNIEYENVRLVNK